MNYWRFQSPHSRWNSLGGVNFGNTLYKAIVIQGAWMALLFTDAWVLFEKHNLEA